MASSQATTPENANLIPSAHGDIVRSTAWLSATSFAVRVLNLLRALVLARLLIPADFGLYGLAITVIGFGMIVSDIGAGSFLLYRARSEQKGIDAAFWLNLFFATIVAGALAASGKLVASIYNNQSLVAIVAVLAVSLWFTVAGYFPRDMLRAQSRFRVLGMVDVLAGALSLIAAVALALLHAGVWALVLSAVLYQSATAVAWQVATRWWPRVPTLGSFRPVFSFAGWFTAAALSWYLVTSVGNLLVGKLLGIAALGSYVLAYNVAWIPVMLVLSPAASVIFPRLAAFKTHDREFWELYESSSRLMATVGIPLCAAMAVAAPDLVFWLFGPQWSPAVLPLQILLAYAAIRLLIVEPYNALGRFAASSVVGSVTLLIEIAAIVILASKWGIVGAAIAVLVVAGGAHVVGLVLCGARAALWRRLRASVGTIVATAISVTLGLAATRLSMSTFPQLLDHFPIAALSGIVVFAILALMSRTYVASMWKDIRRIRELVQPNHPVG
jgi:O-antigen/teichoic acid export membrane protein